MMWLYRIMSRSTILLPDQIRYIDISILILFNDYCVQFFRVSCDGYFHFIIFGLHHDGLNVRYRFGVSSTSALDHLFLGIVRYFLNFLVRHIWWIRSNFCINTWSAHSGRLYERVLHILRKVVTRVSFILFILAFA